jgi:hypothetical protein
MILFLKKAWEWIKKYWKWLLFPVGILAAIISFVIGRSSRDTIPPTPIPDLGKEGEEALEVAKKAAEERDAKLAELRAKHQARLEQMDVEQKKQLEELKDKPLEEVVSWFDNI